MSTTLSEDKILLPGRKAPCPVCREDTYHANIAGAWLCIMCGVDQDTPDLGLRFSAQQLIHVLGRPSTWRAIEALRRTGEAQTNTIAKAAKMSHPNTSLALHQLYEIELVRRKDQLHLNGRGKVKPVWTLNRTHPAMSKLLAVIDECEWTEQGAMVGLTEGATPP